MRTAPDLPSAALVPFLAVTFAIPWLLLGLFLLDPWGVTRWLGEASGSHPLFVLSVWAPAIAAIVVVARHAGGAGVRRFLGRLRIWRAPWGWWAFLLLGMPAVFFGGALLRGGLEGAAPPQMGAGELVVLAVFMLGLGPVEELGWRGVALPLLQRRWSPLVAGLTVGAVWAFWHLPAFLLQGTVQSGWSYTPFVAGTIAASVLMTGFVNAAGGSILVAALFHFQMNNPVFPDARPFDSVLLVVAACGLVVLQRGAMLGRGEGVTRVVAAPSGANSGGSVP